MRKKHTKRALIASIVSVLLCVSMLIGFTFAWFTDTASAGVNTITSGVLDIALYEGTVANGAITYSGDEVTKETKLFDDNALWEPGRVEVAYLKLENKGNLALKYELRIQTISEIIGKNGSGQDIKLSEVLKFGATDNSSAVFYANRTDAVNAVKDNAGTLKYHAVKNDLMLPGETRYLALAIYMPETVGNESNYRGEIAPMIQLGINLVATQAVHEHDSYDNTYDKDAQFDTILNGISATIKTIVKAGQTPADVVIQNGDGSIKATIPGENYKNETNTDQEFTTAFEMEIVEQSAASVTYNVKISITDSEGATVTITEPVTIDIKLPSEMAGATVSHGDNAMEKVENDVVAQDGQYKLNEETGTLSISTTTDGEFKVDNGAVAGVNGKGYTTFAGAFNDAKPGDTITLYEDVIEESTISITKDVSLDLNGNTLTSTASGSGKYPLLVYGGYDVTIKNGFVKTAYASLTQGNLTLENVDFTTSFSQAISPRSGVLTIDKDSTINVENNSSSAVGISIIGNNAGANPTVNVYGTINCAGAYAIAGQGTEKYWGTTINVYPGAEVTAGLCGIFHPQDGTLNIYGGTITGLRSAVEMRNGTLNVEDGNLTATSDTFSFVANNSGITATGVALAVSQHTTEKPINVTINGGTFKGVYALYEGDTVYSANPSEGVAITINGGTFNGTVKSENNTITDNR